MFKIRAKLWLICFFVFLPLQTWPERERMLAGHHKDRRQRDSHRKT